MKKGVLVSAVLFFTTLLMWSGVVSASSFQDAVERVLPKNSERFGKLDSGEKLYAKYFILRMYEENNGKPLWKPKAIRSLAKALDSMVGDGLNPSDYKFSIIKPYLKSPNRRRSSLFESAKIDIALTESYLRAMYNLYYGKTDPQRLDPNNNFGRARDGKDRSEFLLSWVTRGRIETAFNWARPKNSRYKWMKAGLEKYQKIKARGGWSRIPSGKTIRPGDTDSRVPLIRKRLAMTGDLDSARGSDVYDESLQLGMMRFQERHYLTVDGAIGPATLAAMNVPVQKRIDQIRVNLERQRWLFPEESKEFIVVDIAGFTIHYVMNEETVWQEQVQVGKRFTKTPVFKDRIRYLDFNPTWTIPDGIKKRTILPKLKEDPFYLDKKGYRLLSYKGEPMDPTSIDWNSMSKIPYIIRQAPGRNNALGRVKFMFPNKHDVFLHDTNHKELFSKRLRTTSSGCIRLKNPFDLAELLLARQGWNRSKIDRVLASGKTTRVDLKEPIPILIHYSTAWAIENEVSFKKDIYGRDPKLLTALNGPFVFHSRDMSSKNPTGSYSWTETDEPEEKRRSRVVIPSFLDH